MSSPLLESLQAVLTEAGLPDLGPGPRDPAKPFAELRGFLDPTLDGSALPSPNGQLVRALVFLWHDHLDAAHTIAQQIENVDGSYVHAIMHRREPDYGNSKYWFRRVGTHPCFAELAKQTKALLQEKGETDLLARLVPGGCWDAFALVDACEAVAERRVAAAQARLLREVQAVEFRLLLERFCRA